MPPKAAPTALYERAKTVEALPECDQSCHNLIHPFLPQAHR
jgi:hypothetical protein